SKVNQVSTGDSENQETPQITGSTSGNRIINSPQPASAAGSFFAIQQYPTGLNLVGSQLLNNQTQQPVSAASATFTLVQAPLTTGVVVSQQGVGVKPKRQQVKNACGKLSARTLSNVMCL